MGNTIFENNVKMINRRLDSGLRLLNEHYLLVEIDTNGFDSLTIAGSEYKVRQFDIKGVGNLLIMSNTCEGPMQMSTFTLTPYYKNLPLFTTDYMYLENRRTFLNEIYNLVEYKDDLYEKYIKKFAENCNLVAALPDMPMRECWYDNIRPVFVGKLASVESDDLIQDLFIKNLTTFIEMEMETPLLSDAAKTAKWELNHNYAKKLVEDGGVSTNVFVKSIGADETKRFFYSVFFAPDRYSK